MDEGALGEGVWPPSDEELSSEEELEELEELCTDPDTVRGG